LLQKNQQIIHYFYFKLSRGSLLELAQLLTVGKDTPNLLANSSWVKQIFFKYIYFLSTFIILQLYETFIKFVNLYKVWIYAFKLFSLNDFLKSGGNGAEIVFCSPFGRFRETEIACKANLQNQGLFLYFLYK
jgi:hypothetical protein